LNDKSISTYKRINLGVCPIGKFVFSNEDAILNKNKIYEKLNKLDLKYCTLEEILKDGIVRYQDQVDLVIKYFKEESIDALFVPHCNFGTEGAVGLIAKALDVPVLLWGPRDEAPLKDGSRKRDTLCGMLASSKVLNKLKVKFTYIENCHLDDRVFSDGIINFLRAASAVRAVRNARIGQIGSRIDFFWSTIIDESDILKKFGVQVFPYDIVNFINSIKKNAEKNKNKYVKEIPCLKKWLDFGDIKENQIIYSLAMRDEFFNLAQKQNLSAFAYQSFSSVQEELGEGIGLGDALAQERYPITPETDIHGAISSVILEAVSDGQPSFFPEFTVRDINNDNCVLLWHISAPPSLRHEEIQKVKILPPWILKDLPATGLQFRLKDGHVTVCRFDGENGIYKLGAGKGNIISGTYTRETYAWLEVENWIKWERKLIEGPYIHHCSCIYGDYVSALKEACKYLPGLIYEGFDD
jgi:L-fucose isomerase-like protein